MIKRLSFILLLSLFFNSSKPLTEADWQRIATIKKAQLLGTAAVMGGVGAWQAKERLKKFGVNEMGGRAIGASAGTALGFGLGYLMSRVGPAIYIATKYGVSGRIAHFAVEYNFDLTPDLITGLTYADEYATNGFERDEAALDQYLVDQLKRFYGPEGQDQFASLMKTYASLLNKYKDMKDVDRVFEEQVGAAAAQQFKTFVYKMLFPISIVFFSWTVKPFFREHTQRDFFKFAERIVDYYKLLEYKR